MAWLRQNTDAPWPGVQLSPVVIALDPILAMSGKPRCKEDSVGHPIHSLISARGWRMETRKGKVSSTGHSKVSQDGWAPSEHISLG